jgi:hypothetical protein
MIVIIVIAKYFPTNQLPEHRLRPPAARHPIGSVRSICTLRCFMRQLIQQKERHSTIIEQRRLPRPSARFTAPSTQHDRTAERLSLQYILKAIGIAITGT